MPKTGEGHEFYSWPFRFFLLGIVRFRERDLPCATFCLYNRDEKQTSMIFIGLAGYILPIPSLIWAWVRWLKSDPRFVAPAWRSILAFCGLILISAIAAFVVFVFFYANRLSEPAKYSFAVASSRVGFLTSILGLLMSLVGKGRVCTPVALASFGLGALWVVALAMY